MSDIDCKDGDVQKALLDIEKAERDIKVAAHGLEIAEKNLEHAEAELKEAHDHPGHFDVKVLYNGLEREIEVKAKELVSALLAQAISVFGSLPNPHTLSLFAPDGHELVDAQTLRDAGVRACETLLLRPSVVKGGAR